MQNLEGKKLLGESFYLYGCMLLLLDDMIIGSVREKIIISYTRYVVMFPSEGLDANDNRVDNTRFQILMKCASYVKTPGISQRDSTTGP